VEQNHCENGKEVINPQICSTDTLKLKAVLKNVVKKVMRQNSTQKISMAGKTGTAAVNYAKDGGSVNIMLHHFGLFSDDPKYSCIVVA
jgi:cell division protein FtsI (penicillin-binding protein 3)